MRISEDVKRAIVFLGHGEGANFKPSGTGFFIYYDDAQYIVTVKHVAAALGDDPFEMRLNLIDGGGDAITFDPAEDFAAHPWFTHDDPTVDLAVMPMNKDFSGAGYDRLCLHEKMLSWQAAPNEIGLGDVCYAVGLFARFSGRNRNVPVVHVGHLASFGDGERIAVRDRNNPDPRAEVESEGYLVELSNLPGLSGAPVFARPTLRVDFGALLPGEPDKANFQLVSSKLFVLGVWTGSWDGYADDPRMRDVRVPVGMGFVTPVMKLVELLKSSPVAAERDAFNEARRARTIAQPDDQPTGA